MGECHSNVSSKAGVYEIFISPTLAEPLEVAGTVAHELVHVAVGTRAGHKGPFKRACAVLGLVGKPTIALPGPKLNEQLLKAINGLGAYPHSALLPVGKLAKRDDSTIKLVCACGCKVRMSRKWFNECGPCTCGCGSLMEEG